MNDNLKIHTLRVFVDENGRYGTPMGIILDERKGLDSKERQRIATGLGYSESIFINDLKTGSVSIFNPQEEIPFAGQVAVGAAWFIHKTTGQPIVSLTCAGGTIETWTDNDETWIRANLAMMPPWLYEQLKGAVEIETLSSMGTSAKEHTFVWAWVDESKGVIRARTFAPDWGIPEDAANGSGSMKLAATLGRAIKVIHGEGSVIYAKPWKSNFADLGGRVVEE